MSLYRRGGSTWWIAFTTPGGRRIRRSARTSKKSEAQRLLDELKAEAWKVEVAGEKPKRSWQEAVVRFVEETRHKASHKDDIGHLRWLDSQLGALMLDEIDGDRVAAVKHAKLKEGVSNATVNRMLAVLRTILYRSRDEWGWLAGCPKIRALREPEGRTRWLSHEEADRLLDELPPHLRDMAALTLAVGLRQRNIKRLMWRDVDFEQKVIRIGGQRTKNGEALVVPLNRDALEILERRRGDDDIFVFTYRGKPIEQVATKAWRNALKRAGIEDFRWHDLRHTWASWHVNSGTPLEVLKELGGWKSMSMVLRYAHLAPSRLAEHAERISRQGRD